MQKKQALPKQAVGFIETMDCLPVSRLPEGPKWTYEIKLDGYRLEVVRRGRETTLYSRRQNVFNQKFPYIAAALKDLPDDTVLDGEVVALGPDGRPDFNLLQNFRSAESRIHYYAFDILVHNARRLTELPLSMPYGSAGTRGVRGQSGSVDWRVRRPGKLARHAF